MSEMRKVTYSKYIKVNEDGRNFMELRPQGLAIFHRFGVDYEEFESGAGNYSTAIIEAPDGTIHNIPVENVKFIEPSQDHQK